MRRVLHLGIVVSVGMIAAPASAGPGLKPTASIPTSPLGGGDFDDRITLTVSTLSPVPIGSLRFSRVPTQDFMGKARQPSPSRADAALAAAHGQPGRPVPSAPRTGTRSGDPAHSSLSYWSRDFLAIQYRRK
jgi:hypothetical protein